jgi:6-phosphogluconolactonase
MKNVFYLFLLLFAFSCSPKSIEKTNQVGFFIGTYTGKGSEGIYHSYLDTETGELSQPKLVAPLKNPSFQSISPNGKFLWSVCEADGTGSISSFQIKNDSLIKLGTTTSNGEGPCYVNFDEATSTVFAANYRSGNVSKWKTAKGKLTEKGSAHQHEGNGPQTDRQEGPHAHCFIFDLNHRYGYSCDLGADKIYVYETNSDSLHPIETIAVTPGNGPRHIAFSPNKKIMAVVNELGSSVSVFKPDERGIFSVFHDTYPALPDTFTQFSKAADIHFTPNGQYLYASNRGHNSIAIFKVKKDLTLERIGWQAEKCNFTRNFAIDPSGKYLLAANQYGNSIVVFQIDYKTGKLVDTGHQIDLSQPVCITFQP